MASPPATPHLPPHLRHQAIAELLRAGATYEQTRAQVGGGSQTLLVAVRRTEGIPHLPRPRLCRTPEETYALYAEPYGAGHARWTGAWAGRMPQIQHPGRYGRKESALRVAFRWRHGREPEGRVKPGCGDRACVASGHLTDRTVREQLRQQR
ncbi:hypothetical protein [Streptomyces olivaceus]|uniref:hypothetical protein n=1 Tax=Streptomyces olivaceus TaxID=47716 RepID=UPI0022EE121F|nr:hypothetical protein [Streptomyces olivaceus]GHI91306.1 hypothetical protein TPA0905_07770 [Streptomyces olivaceus]